MKRFTFILSCFLVCLINVTANQPAKDLETLQIQSIGESDFIFLGEPISINWTKNLATFRIFEIFKGKYNIDTVVFSFNVDENLGLYSMKYSPPKDTSEESFAIKEADPTFEQFEGLWVVYLYKLEDSRFHLYRDLSRSIQHPERLFIWPYVIKSIDSTIDKSQLRIDAINDWFLEIERLRKIKSYEVTREETVSVFYLVIPTILSIVNLAVLIYLLIKRKASR
jgi:hypothetical protein